MPKDWWPAVEASACCWRPGSSLAWKNGAGLSPEPPRGWSPFAVASIATLVLLLALAGSLFGIYVSDQDRLAADSTSETRPPVTSGAWA